MSGKNACAARDYDISGFFAEQLIYGVSIIVILRSRSDETVRVAIIARDGASKPISMGTELRPERPIFSSGPSVTEGDSVPYGSVLKYGQEKKRVTIIGRERQDASDAREDSVDDKAMYNRVDSMRQSAPSRRRVR